MNHNWFKYLLLVLTLASLTACGEAAGTTDGTEREVGVTNPRSGWVLVDDGYDTIEKTCDGETLIYKIDTGRGGGIAAIPNSPECGYDEEVAE